MSTLHVEQPWTSLSLLFRPHYRVEVFDEHDAPVMVGNVSSSLNPRSSSGSTWNCSLTRAPTRR